MSLTFGGATSDLASKSSPTGTTQLSQWSLIQWVYPTTLTAARYLFSSGGTTAGLMNIRLADTLGNVRVGQNGTGTNATFTTNDTPLALNTWCCIAVAVQLSVSGAVYGGTLTAPLTLRTLGTNTLGGTPLQSLTGTAVTELGNLMQGATAAFQGRIGFTQLYNRVLTLGEFRTIQYTGRMLSGCVGFWYLGDTGTSAQPDYSGSGNALTVTGATQSSNPPLRSTLHRGLRVPYAVSGGGGGPSAAALYRHRQRMYGG